MGTELETSIVVLGTRMSHSDTYTFTPYPYPPPCIHAHTEDHSEKQVAGWGGGVGERQLEPLLLPSHLPVAWAWAGNKVTGRPTLTSARTVTQGADWSQAWILISALPFGGAGL